MISEEETKPQGDYYFPTKPEGKIKIVQPSGGEGFSMPFAKIDGGYRIIIGEQTEKSYADTKAAADPQKIAEGMDEDLATTGKKIAADGGEFLAIYKSYLAAIAKGDTEYLAANGTAGDKYFFGKAYKDNPVKRGVALELARLESIKEPTIKGGYEKDGKAILLVSGVNGQGWTTEGAVLLMQNDGIWAMEDRSYVSYPPSRG